MAPSAWRRRPGRGDHQRIRRDRHRLLHRQPAECIRGRRDQPVRGGGLSSRGSENRGQAELDRKTHNPRQSDSTAEASAGDLVCGHRLRLDVGLRDLFLDCLSDPRQPRQEASDRPVAGRHIDYCRGGHRRHARSARLLGRQDAAERRAGLFDPMTARGARRLGWLAFAVTLACIPLTALMLSQHLRGFLPAESLWSTVVVFVGAAAFSVTGALIVSQHARHAIGWAFVLSGLATAGAVVLAAYAELALAPGWSLPAGGIAQGVSPNLIQGGIFLPLTLGLLLFPDGHLLSPRWWIAAAAAGLGLVLRVIGGALSGPNPSPPELWGVGVLLPGGSALAGVGSPSVA